MEESSQHSQQNTTIGFIPERINRRPVVTRGMTFFELVIVLITGAIVGAFVGLLVMILFGLGWFIITVGMLIFGFLFLRFGGFYISRLKRGKPDSWLDRWVEFKLSSSKFITQDYVWSIKRIFNKTGKK